MKSVVTTAIATLMLLGILSAAALPNNSKTMVAGGGNPMPMCYPTDQGCAPPIPPR